jgi:hypothetical protein
MKSEKNVTDPVRIASRVNAQSSVGPKTKQVRPKRVAPEVAPAGRLTSKRCPKPKLTNVVQRGTRVFTTNVWST